MSATFAFFPAGLVLYWVTNTVLSIAQQWNINRRISAQPPASGAGGNAGSGAAARRNDGALVAMRCGGSRAR